MAGASAMNQKDADRWKSEILDEIFAALAADNQIAECLIFKGARVLNARLGGGRQSLDLDSNLMKEFVERHPNREEQGRYLEHHLKRAIYRHFERHDPVRFELKGLTVHESKWYHPFRAPIAVPADHCVNDAVIRLESGIPHPVTVARRLRPNRSFELGR
jgi:hypothetical protein